jgi:hypothetical protein
MHRFSLPMTLAVLLAGVTVGFLMGELRPRWEAHAEGAMAGEVVAVTGQIINGNGDVLYVLDKPSNHLLVYGYSQDGSLALLHSRKIDCDLRPVEFHLRGTQQPSVKAMCEQTKEKSP